MSDSIQTSKIAKGLSLSLVSLLLLAGAGELALRLVDAPVYRLVYQMRQVFGYAGWTHVDLRPNRRANLHLRRNDGTDLFNFTVTADPRGLRPTASPAPADAPVVHCIGDSVTMGWGVQDDEAFPAQLARQLAPRYQVLNLGVTAYGLAAAAEKSRRTAGTQPPAVILYTFCPNDFDDDVLTLQVQARPAWRHAVARAMDAIKQRSYVFNMAYAAQVSLYWKPSQESAQTDFFALDVTEGLDQAALRARAAASAPADNASTRALEELRRQCQATNTRLVVLITDASPGAMQLGRFCLDRGIGCEFMPMDRTTRIPGDGHFTPAGNGKFARDIQARLFPETLAPQNAP